MKKVSKSHAVASHKASWKHQDVFETYFLLGPGRTFKELAANCNLAVDTLRTWGKQFGWAAELEKRDREAAQIVKNFNNELYIAQVKDRHVKMYRQAQAKAMKQLNRKKDIFRDDKDAAIGLDIAIKGEREVMGLRDTKVKAGFLNKDGFAAMVEAVIGPD